jgi:hypothetical protein
MSYTPGLFCLKQNFINSLGILANPAPLADVFTAQEPVTLLHKRAQRAVALGHYVVRRVQRIAATDSDLAALHQSFHFLGRCHVF